MMNNSFRIANIITNLNQITENLNEAGFFTDDLIDISLRVAKKDHGGLDDWFNNEHWVDVRRPKKDGKGFEPCGRSDSKDGKKPVCTPANKAKILTEKERKQRMKEKSHEEKGKSDGKKPKLTNYSDGAGGKSNIS